MPTAVPPGRVLSPHVPDHDHDHDDDLLPLEDNPVWQQDNVVLSTVGMDIGSSGTQVLFSRLHLRRMGEDLTSRYVVIRRDTVYLSPVEFTPYAGEWIDVEALGSIVDRAYAGARMSPAEVDTGVVILTGEALRRRNAAAIARVLAERGGELVTATAGHSMEALLAAYGSGAAQRSHETGQRLLVVDVGGGTTKLAVVDSGRIAATAAVHVGGRLQVVDDEGRITRLEPAGREHARRAGFDWTLGDHVSEEELAAVAEGMADAVVAAITGDPDPELLLTAPLPRSAPIDGVVFSGGVGEYVYDRENRWFGDLGPFLGRALRSRVDRGELPFTLLPAGECIRATALGASEYSVQLSGNTSFISDPDALLPRRNLPVVRPRLDLDECVDAAAVAAAIRRQLSVVLPDGPDTDPGPDVVLALSWSGVPAYERLLPFAQGIRDGVAARSARGFPLYAVLDGDVARSVGRLLRDELGVGVPLAVIDGIALRDFDHLDLGRVRHPSGTVPVTIKSMVFADHGGGP